MSPWLAFALGVLAAFVVSLAFTLVVIGAAQHDARLDRALSWCPHCGEPRQGNYCANCDDGDALPAWRNADTATAWRAYKDGHPPACECVACRDRAQAEALLAAECGATRELQEDV